MLTDCDNAHDNAHVADNIDNDFDQLVQDEQLLSEAMDEHDLYNFLDIVAHSVAEPEKSTGATR